jgi:outer membrane protein assembly factor BamB
VAVGGGRAYVGLANADLIALDERHGTLLWIVRIGDEGWKGVSLGRQPAHAAAQSHNEWGQNIAAAPGYVDETVIVKLGNGDSGSEAELSASTRLQGAAAGNFLPYRLREIQAMKPGRPDLICGKLAGVGYG